MADKPLRLDEIGYWSEVKLEIIKKYHNAYSRIMSLQRAIRDHIYIDGFAGAGTHISKATGDAVSGSPLNALQIDPPFTELHLVDLQGSRTNELRRLTQGNARVSVHHGNCNEVLLNELLPRCRWEDRKRALCVLDPYALNVNFEVLKTAGQMKSIEVFYNFMIMDANMNVFMRDPSKVTPAQGQRMTEAWGDGSWASAAWRTTQDLFGDREDKSSNEEIAEAFRVRLRDVAGLPMYQRQIPMRNSKGAVVYYLYFASPNKTGAKIVGEIFDKYRSRGA